MSAVNPNFYQTIDAALRRFPAQEVIAWPAENGKGAIPTTAKDLLDPIAGTGNYLKKNGIRMLLKT